MASLTVGIAAALEQFHPTEILEHAALADAGEGAVATTS